MKFIACAAIFAVAACAGAARADEGLWTFDQFPSAKVKAAYGVEIDQAWLNKVQAAAARLSVGCSSSIVSGQGLLLTNNHCVADCARAVSPAGSDYLKNGFLAAIKPEEKACPQMDAEILTGITDVTARMTAAGAGLTGVALVKARSAMSSTISQEICGADAKFHCEMVTLYQGGRYEIYKYRKYSDVRLVFSPGYQAAFFGGDPDNFNFPRYDLDAAFLRLYEDGKPVATPQHLTWNPTPPKLGEPVFTAGNPGRTFRELTVSQLDTQRDLAVPMTLTQLSELRGRLIGFGESGPDAKKLADEALEDVENSYKVYFGWTFALADPAFITAKRAAEDDLRAKTMAAAGPGAADPWAALAKVQPAARALYLPYHLVERGPFESTLFDYARGLVRAAEEREKPSAERLPEYADSQLAVVKQQLLDPYPVQRPLERINLEFWLSKTREYLTADDPDTKLLLGNDSPETLAERLADNSRLADPAVRQALWDGGVKAIEASDDPMIQFVLKIDPEARRIRWAYEDQVTGPATHASEAIAKARLAAYGEAAYPDGTFTLRLSYGQVQGWTYRGKTTPAFTTFAGLWTRATGQYPFDVDARWTAAKDKLNPDTVFDFVTTNDIIGGNSGSPLLNAKAEVIGAAFDGNILSLGGDYGYDGRVNRCVVVSAAAVTEALAKVYGADALLAELKGG
jgi:hypothetical protein